MAFKALSDNLSTAGEKTQEYIENTSEYYKLRLFKYTMKFATSLVISLIIGSLSLLVLAFVSIGFSLWLSRIIGYPSAGFFVVGGFYLVTIALISIFGRKAIIKAMLTKFSALLVEEGDRSNMAEGKRGCHKTN